MTSDLGVNIWTILPNSNDTLIIFIADIHHSTSRKTNTHEKTENLTVTKPLPSPQTLLLTANDKDQNWSTSVMLGQCRNTSLKLILGLGIIFVWYILFDSIEI